LAGFLTGAAATWNALRSPTTATLPVFDLMAISVMWAVGIATTATGVGTIGGDHRAANACLTRPHVNFDGRPPLEAAPASWGGLAEVLRLLRTVSPRCTAYGVAAVWLGLARPSGGLLEEAESFAAMSAGRARPR
jgi:hypothetical protein